MNKLFLIPLLMLVSNCSGIASEAKRDESNPLLKPPFIQAQSNKTKQQTIIEIYSKPTCPYCIKTKALLDAKHIAYKEYDVTGNTKLSQEAVERSGGRRSVPQIFIKGKHVGGYAELEALNSAGELDKMLAE